MRSFFFKISNKILLILIIHAVLIINTPVSGIVKNNIPLMHAKDIRRGMKGYGLTVFQGNKIEKFSVDILGVLTKTGPGSNLILAKISGGPIKHTGVIAGMSGSPVYINGKLIGAIAYTWGFTKTPIAGITPISEMLDVFKFKKAKKPPKFKIRHTEKTKLHGKKISYNNSSFRPVKTPIIFSGMNPAVFSILSSSFKDQGFMPVIGGGASRRLVNSKSYDKLYPGSAIGVQLVSGDMNITGIGTVTYVNRDKILAFGHPMMMRGNASFPMTSAYIHTIMPSMKLSFKLGSPVKKIGSIYQDRKTAIAGSYNIKPKVLPAAITFSHNNRTKTYNYSIIRDDLLFAKLFASVILNTLVSKSSSQGRLSYNIDYEFNIRETKTGRIHKVRVKDSFATFMSLQGYYNAVIKILKPLQSLLFNNYKKVELKNIKVSIKAVPDIRAVQITALKTDVKKVRPGDIVKLRVKLKPYQGKPFWKTLSIRVPKNALNAKIFFVVSSAGHERYYDKIIAPAKYQAASLKNQIEILNTDRNSSDLVVWSELYQHGLIINGQKLPNIPSSVFKLFAKSSIDKIGFLNAHLRKVFHSNYFIYGLKFIFLEMDHSNYK